MASELKVNKISPESGTTLTLGDSGDTINFGSGVLPNFENLTVTGDLTVDTNSLKVDSTNNFVGIGTATPSVALDVVGAITATGNITGTLATASQPNITSLGTLTGLTTTGNINLGDSDVINFGASNDLQIYHDGSNSYIKDVGTGNLFIDAQDLRLRSSTGEKYAVFIQNGSSTLYYDDAEKLATTSTGIDVTGRITIDEPSGNGTLIIDGSATSSSQIRFAQDGTAKGYLTYWDSSDTLGLTDGLQNGLHFSPSTANVGIGTSSPTEKLHISTSGNSKINLQTTSSASRTQLFGVDNLGNNNYALGSNNNTDTEFWNYKNGFMRFATNSTERMRLTSDGPHLLLGGTADVNEITETSSNAGMVIGNTSVGNGGLAIITGTTGAGRIYFGDATGSDLGRNRGQINYYHSSDYMMFATTNTERMRIDSSGNVGIGTSSPTNKFHVQAGSAGGDPTLSQETVVFESNQNNYIVNLIPATASFSGFGFSTNTTNVIGGMFYSPSNNYMVFRTVGTERIRISSGGLVGIGTTTPSTALDVNGTVTATAFSGDGSGLTNVPAGMSLFNIVKVTATGTYTPTSGTKFVRVYCTGGGGGAGGWGTVDSTDSGRGSGGSGGNTGVKHYTATELGSSASITIGSGGSGGTGGASPTNGGTGGNTTFNPAGTGATLTGYGGKFSYGFKQARSQLVDLSWNTSTGNADYIHFGELGIISPLNVVRAGTQDYFASTAGGRSYFGVGGAGRLVTSGNGENGYSAAANSGGGGGGGVAYDFGGSPPAYNGGSGGSGVVVIEEYA